MKNNKKVKLISGVLVATMVVSGFTACSNENKKTAFDLETSSVVSSSDDKVNHAIVLINVDNAVIFSGENVPEWEWYADEISFYSENIFESYRNFSRCDICYHDKDELESKIRAIIGQDGQITYQEDYGKVKK